MDVKIKAKGITLSPAFNEHAEKKLAKLNRFFGEDFDAKISLEKSGAQQISLEITIIHGGMIYRAQRRAAEKESALDEAVDLIIRQIRKHKTKVEKRLHVKAFDLPFEDEIPDERKYEVIKRKRFVLEPMNSEEAILRMNMLGHGFFMYRDGDSGIVCVAYKRGDGHYAVLEGALHD